MPIQERPIDERRSPFPSTASLVVLLTASVVISFTTVERYLDPEGEKYISLMTPGSADFILTFSGARALARGENPYHNEFVDPWGRRRAEVDGKMFNLVYPPSQLLFYVPLAWLTDDPRAAGRMIFGVNLALLMLLATLTWWLVAQVSALASDLRRFSLLLIPLLFFLMTANVGSCLGLERGQSDIIGAALCWGAVVLFLQGHSFLPVFLTVSATLMKGYALPLAVGIGLLSLSRRSVKASIAGGVAAVALLLLPVLQYVPDGLVAARWHAVRFTGGEWFNHSFRSVFYNISPEWAEAGRVAMTLISVLVAAGCWLRARRALRQGARTSATFWVGLFASAALAAPIGYAGASFLYNQILILPGAFLFLLLRETFSEECHLPAQAIPVLGVLQVVIVFLLFKYRLTSETWPLAGVALVIMVLSWGAGLIVGEWIRDSRRMPRSRRWNESEDLRTAE